MKRALLYAFSLATVLFGSLAAQAQETLAPDQNPNYMVSRARYMKMADSINTWHGVTFQDTYKAIDFLQDRHDARMQRQAFRRELRLERARNGYYNWNNGGNFYPGFYNSYPYRFNRNYYNRYLWSGVPFPLSFGLQWR